MLVAALQAGLLAAGREVWDLGLCPTPAVAWLTRHQRAAGGLMISASHNPPADNGIKVFARDGCKLPLHQQKDLEQWLQGPAPLGCHGGGSSRQRHDLLKVYEQGLLQQLEPGQGRRLRVVLDLCWGAATSCAVSMFEQLGAAVTTLHGQPCLVITQMANLGFRRAWTERGGVLEETPVGDQHVYAAMERTGAALGGEQSGHVLWSRHHFIGDGLMTALQLTQLTAGSGHSLAALIEESFSSYPQKLTNVRITDSQARETWKYNCRLQDGIAAAEAAMGRDGRVLVRASGTEPLLRVMVEAREASMVEDWSHRLVALAAAELRPS